MKRTWLVLMLVMGCRSAGGNKIAEMAVNTALAGTASVANRSAGGCYAVCQQGESCNPKNGRCEPIPCHGQCGATETCEAGADGDRCVPMPALSVTGSAPASKETKAPPRKNAEVPAAALPH